MKVYLCGGFFFKSGWLYFGRFFPSAFLVRWDFFHFFDPADKDCHERHECLLSRLAALICRLGWWCFSLLICSGFSFEPV